MTATDDQFNLWAEASISHRNPRDVDVETLLHQLRNSDIRVSAALAAENLGGPTEKYLAIIDRCEYQQPEPVFDSKFGWVPADDPFEPES